MIFPPVAIVLCSNCRNFSLLLADSVLPLAKDIMIDGTLAKKEEHILGEATEYLRRRVCWLIEELEAMKRRASFIPPNPEKKPISHVESRAFVEEELQLLDDPRAFDEIFGRGPGGD